MNLACNMRSTLLTLFGTNDDCNTATKMPEAQMTSTTHTWERERERERDES